MENNAKPVVLALSGHDPSGAAGIQADIEALVGAGCHCVSVITALTTQNTSEFRAMEPQPAARFGAQLDLLTDDIRMDACKIGLIGSSQLVGVIAAYLRDARYPVVLDPVLATGTGTGLASPGLVSRMTEQLLPLATVITPNLEEAIALTGYDETAKALHALLDLGCHTALITSAGNGRDEVVNTWMDNNREIHSYHREKLPGVYHGSGCTLSAHLAGRLARGDSVQTAVENAQDYTWQALKNALRIGKSQLHPGRICQ